MFKVSLDKDKTPIENNSYQIKYLRDEEQVFEINTSNSKLELDFGMKSWDEFAYLLSNNPGIKSIEDIQYKND